MTTTTVEGNKKLVSKFFELLSSGKIDPAFELLAVDLKWLTLSNRQGMSKDSVKEMITWLFGSVLQGPIKQRITSITAEDNRVAAMAEGHAITQTGEPYDNLYFFLFEIRDGLICQIWEFNDPLCVQNILRNCQPPPLSTTD